MRHARLGPLLTALPLLGACSAGGADPGHEAPVDAAAEAEGGATPVGGDAGADASAESGGSGADATTRDASGDGSEAGRSAEGGRDARADAELDAGLDARADARARPEGGTTCAPDGGRGAPPWGACASSDAGVSPLVRFGPPIPVDVGASVLAALVADVNGDGYDDLVVTDVHGVDVMLSQGDGTFAAPVSSALTNSFGVYGLVSGDVDGDGRPDLVVAEQLTMRYGGPYCPSVCGTAALVALMGHGDGTFSPERALHDPLACRTSRVFVEDLDGDGVGEVALGGFDHARNQEHCQIDVGGELTAERASGAPFFSQHLASSVSSATGADLDGDGVVDLVAVGDGGVSLFEGLGHGAFGAASTLATTPVTTVARGDLDGDGTSDVVAGTATDAVVILGTCGGPPKPARSFPLGAPVAGTADFNGDGLADVLGGGGANGGSPTVIAVSASDGTLGSPQLVTAVSYFDLGVGDFNGDGLSDLVSFSSYGGGFTQSFVVRLNAGCDDGPPLDCGACAGTCVYGGCLTTAWSGAVSGSIVTGSSDLFFGSGADVVQFPLGGAAPSVLASDGASLVPIALDGTRVYFGTHAGISSVPIGGGSETAVASLPRAPSSLAFGGGSLFYAYNSGVSDALDLDVLPLGGAPTTLYSSRYANYVDWLALTAGKVVFANDGNPLAVLSMNEDGTGLVTLASHQGVRAMAVDARDAFVADDLGLVQVPLDGSGETRLASWLGGLRGIALDAKSVYFSTDGSVATIPKAGGPITVLADGVQAKSLAVVGKDLYLGTPTGLLRLALR